MISIGMCTYNGKKYIQEQLESIINQTLQPDEIVICDDCSNDNTPIIIRDTLGKWSGKWYLIVNEANLGFKKNFQKVISLCTGDIIFLSDQDDIWNNRKIEIMYEAFKSHPQAVMAFHDSSLVDEKLNLLYPSFWKILGFNPKIFLSKDYHILLKNNVLQGSACAFKKKVFHCAEPFPTMAIHDEWLLLIAITMGEIIPVDDILMKYRQGNNLLGASPSLSIKEKVVKWRTNYKNELLNHYKETFRRWEVFVEYAKRYSNRHDLEVKFNFLEYEHFLNLRVNYMTNKNILIFKFFFKYFIYYEDVNYALKTFIKDFLVTIVLYK